MVNRKNMFKKRTKTKKKLQHRQRRTYTIYGNKATRDKIEVDRKRKPEVTPDEEALSTQQKVEEESFSSDSDEQEVEDPMKQLRETFGGKYLKKVVSAIESSSDSDFDVVDDKEEESDDVADEEMAEAEVEFKENECELENEDETVGDMFSEHLLYDLSENMLKNLQSCSVVTENSTVHWPCLGTLAVQIPRCEEKQESQTKIVNLSAEQKTAAPGKVPRILSSKERRLAIKIQIRDNVENKNVTSGRLFTPLQNEIFSVINNYQDLYYSQRTVANAEELRFVYCVHVTNHVLKTRTKVLHHNARLSKKDDVPEEFRDQGLVRPKVLIIVPFRDSCYRIINMLIDILLTEDKGNVINKTRFIEDFTGNEIVMPKKNPKPEDYEATFSGNCGDDFKIGITITKKSLKLYADFYSSDIIIASPLGLRFTIGAEGEADRDYDFLSSIELLVLDQTEIFLMQNWDHLLHIFNHLHLQPKDSHGTDFSRVRTWSLDGYSKYYRQTLIFSSIVLPEINAIFNKRCQNYSGKVKVVNEITDGSIGQVVVQLPHVYHKFECASVSQSVDARFDFFVNKILPQHKETLMKQTLIYVASYFDFVRLRNYFKKEDLNFVQICEYSKDGKVARARDMFFHGDAHFLLYTERYHFFHRIRVKGIRHLIFFQPPNFPHFYYEMCNLMQEAYINRKVGSNSNMTVTVLYSKYDVHQLSAIVTTERAAKMIQSERNVHMMITGSD